MEPFTKHSIYPINSHLPSLTHFIEHPVIMGNEVSSKSAVSVILADGTMVGFEKPLTAAELMLDHPNKVVVEYRPKAAGVKPRRLPADEKLEIKRVYMMLPMRRGELTAEDMRRVLSCAGAVVRSRSLLSCAGIVPEIVKAVSRSAGGRFVVWLAPEMKRPEYLRRQVSGRGWRPSLDTIKEKTIERKVSHWLF